MVMISPGTVSFSLPGHNADCFFEDNKIFLSAWADTTNPCHTVISYLCSRDAFHLGNCAGNLWLQKFVSLPVSMGICTHRSITHINRYSYGLSTDYSWIYMKIYVHIMLWRQLNPIYGIAYGWLVCTDQHLLIHTLVSTPGWWEMVEKWVRYSQNTVSTVSHSFLKGFW